MESVAVRRLVHMRKPSHLSGCWERRGKAISLSVRSPKFKVFAPVASHSSPRQGQRQRAAWARCLRKTSYVRYRVRIGQNSSLCPHLAATMCGGLRGARNWLRAPPKVPPTEAPPPTPRPTATRITQHALQPASIARAASRFRCLRSVRPAAAASHPALLPPRQQEPPLGPP